MLDWKDPKIDKHGAKWWHASHDDAMMANRMYDFQSFLLNEQKDVRRRISEFLSLYTSRKYILVDNMSGRMKEELGVGERRNLVYINVVQMAIDTLVAQTTVQKVRPFFATSHGSFSDRLKARGLQHFIDGTFHAAKVHSTLMPENFLVACLSPLGSSTKVLIDDWEIKYGRCMPEETLLDLRVALNTTVEPRSRLQRVWVPAEVLAARFPEHADKIFSSSMQLGTTDDDSEGKAEATSLVLVVEGWHLRSCKGAEDGVHSIAIKDQLLHRAQYDFDDFPFMDLEYKSAGGRGWGGQCVAEVLEPIQTRMDEMAARLMRALHIASVSIMLAPRAAGIPSSFFTNEPGTLIEFDGQQKPEVYVAPAMHPQFIDMYFKLKEEGLSGVGTSEFSATGKKPAGIEHAPGMEMMLDVESLRHQRQHDAYEQSGIRLTELTMRAARTLHFYLENHRSKDDEKKKENEASDIVVPDPKKPPTDYLRAMYYNNEGWTEIQFGDHTLEADKYVIQCHPTNLLAKTPSKRVAQVFQMIDKGMVRGPQAIALMASPDLEAYQSMETAELETVDMQLDTMVFDGKPVEPLVWQNLELAISRGTMRLHREFVKKTPQDRLDLIVEYLVRAKAAKDANDAQLAAKMMEAQAAQQPPPPPGMPDAGPAEAPANAPPMLPPGPGGPPQ